MNFIKHVLLVVILPICSVYAEGPPLSVGIMEGFNPPFEIEGGGHNIYGFDIDLMNALCSIMDRTCVFHMIPFKKLINAVENKTVDVAISTITITMQRSQLVNFSEPYLLSHSRFLTYSSNDAIKQPFSLKLLDNKKIGVQKGSIFPEQILVLGIKNPDIKEYDTNTLLAEALSNKSIDYILFGSANVNYWAANSGGKFIALGPTFLYGNGYGIAINKTDNQLLTEINRALGQYLNSAEYKMNYNKYLEL